MIMLSLSTQPGPKSRIIFDKVSMGWNTAQFSNRLEFFYLDSCEYGASFYQVIYNF